MASSEEIPAELLQALGAPGATPGAPARAEEIPAELMAALGNASPAPQIREPAPSQGDWMSYVKAAAPWLNRAGHAGSLAIGAPEATDISRLSKMLANSMGGVYGKELPVSEGSKTLAALKGLFTGQEPVSGYADTLKEMDIPSGDILKVSPLAQALKAGGVLPKGAALNSNDALGLAADLLVNPGTLPGAAVKLPGKALSKSGNNIFDNAWRFVTRDFGGKAGKSKNPAINKENFLKIIKEEGVGKGAHTPQDIADQYAKVVDKELAPLDEMMAKTPNSGISIAPGHNETSLNEIQAAMGTGDRAAREAALDRLKEGAAPEFQGFIDKMKDRLLESKGQVEGPFNNFLSLLKDGPLSLKNLRGIKGNQWELASELRGAPKHFATEYAGSTNDLMANVLENASIGGEKAFRNANERAATILKPQSALLREVTKAEGVAPHSSLDGLAAAWAVAKLMSGNFMPAVEAGTALAGKKATKALNSLATGSRVGQSLMSGGKKIENVGQKIQNARGGLWSLLTGGQE